MMVEEVEGPSWEVTVKRWGWWSVRSGIGRDERMEEDEDGSMRGFEII